MGFYILKPSAAKKGKTCVKRLSASSPCLQKNYFGEKSFYNFPFLLQLSNSHLSNTFFFAEFLIRILMHGNDAKFDKCPIVYLYRLDSWPTAKYLL